MSIASDKAVASRPLPDDATAASEAPRQSALAQAAENCRHLARSRPLWLRLTLALALLAVEVLFFTLLFEFTSGPMRLVANSVVLTGLVVGAIGFAMCSSVRPGPKDLPGSECSAGQSAAWLAAHLVLLGVFFFLTRWLHSSAPAGWGLSLVWLALAGGVAACVLLAAVPARWIAAYVRGTSVSFAAAAVVALLMIGLTPPVRELWMTVDGVALEMIRRLLEWYPGYASIHFLGDSSSVPIVGTSNMSLVVTEHCSEMDSLLAYGLLGSLLLVAGGRRMLSFYYLAPFLVGFELLYAINALRLYLLVLMGHVMADTSGAAYAGRACVSLAHSRVGNFFLLGVAVLILMVGERLSRREWMAGDSTA